MSISVFLLAVVLVSGVCGDACTRKPPPGTDCSTFDTVCHVQNTNSGGEYLEEMEWPDENTRTCYRTCIEETPLHYDICEATLTGVHNQKLKKDPYNPDYSLQRLFSPNYKDGEHYRKSTICRYNVKCDEGQQLSYSFLEHNLEDRKMCSGNNECIDSFNVEFPNYGNTIQTTCGTEINTSVVYQDGGDELTVEFMTNRETQYPGFYMFVWCISPSYGGEYNNRRSTSQYQSCTVPPTDRENYGDKSALVQDPFRPRRSALPRPITLVLQTGEWVTYNDNTIIVTRTRNYEEVIQRFPGVTRFLVYNRITPISVHYQNSSGRFSGYGHLRIARRNAFFRQEGVKPEDRPTYEETKLILDLEKGLLVKHFEDEYFDVWDEQDDTEMYNKTNSTYSYRNPHEEELEPERMRYLQDTSMEYGNACNGLLRAAACAYQEVVLKRDCNTGELIGTDSQSFDTLTTRLQPTMELPQLKSDMRQQ